MPLTKSQVQTNLNITEELITAEGAVGRIHPTQYPYILLIGSEEDFEIMIDCGGGRAMSLLLLEKIYKACSGKI